MSETTRQPLSRAAERRVERIVAACRRAEEEGLRVACDGGWAGQGWVHPLMAFIAMGGFLSADGALSYDVAAALRVSRQWVAGATMAIERMESRPGRAAPYYRGYAEGLEVRRRLGWEPKR